MVLLLHILLPILLIQAISASEDSCGEKCCKRRVVGGIEYLFQHENENAIKKHGCLDECVYTMDGGKGDLICFKNGNLTVDCLKCRKLPGLPKKYCQPGQKCWPNGTEIENFRSLINGSKDSCLGLQRFVAAGDSSAHNHTCLRYTGLVEPDKQCQNKKLRPWNTGNYQTPDPNCDPNPFVTGAYYKSNGLACMTPYQFLNNRNYKKEWMAAFIVTAETPEDIKLAITFARHHNLGISVLSTGHDMQDRNAGPGPNTLLVRTTCFRHWSAVTNESIKDSQGNIWYDGYAVVGAGLSFGTNFWTDLENAEGTYALAAKSNKETVGGTCHSVGIVGWSIGGGRGWTSPKYGLGVDQLLQVDLVAADGRLLSASNSINPDLFYAIRGGGSGFGIIYSIKIKLHNASCTDRTGNHSMTHCYSMNSTYTWTGVYKENTMDYVKRILDTYLKWSVENRNSWNSIVQFHYNKTTNKYAIKIEANQFGHQNGDIFKLEFQNYTEDRKPFQNPINSSKYWCEIFPDANNGDNCTDAPWHLERWAQAIRFVVNSTVTDNSSSGFLDDLLSTWQPSCDKYPYAPCASGFQIHGDLPAINQTSKKGVYDSGGAVSDGFRDASFQVFNLGVNSEKVNLTFIQEEEWMHYTLGPALYKYSNASYFNEAEYTLDPGHWEERFWGKEKHCKLMETKMKFDPTFTFACRHCVGSEVGSEPKMK